MLQVSLELGCRLVVQVVDGPQGQEDLLMEHQQVELVYQHHQQTIDNKKVLMHFTVPVVAAVAVATVHLKEEMVDLVL